ncbi:MAG: tyrosine--tRNA ligase [Chloroflexi bacterium]|nr:tyrosine--tRNA ligase [Chloroflexota bacterium]
MKFILSPEVLQRAPDLVVGAVVAWNVDNHGRKPAVVEARAQAIAACRKALVGRDPETHPHIARWREAFRAAGLNPRRMVPSMEALATRLMKGEEPLAVNSAVDIATAVSLSHLLPVGAHDLEGLPGDIGVRQARPGDRFTPMGSASEEAVPEGEIVYATGEEVRTRGWVWRQGERSKVTEESRTIFFPVDGFHSLEPAVRQATLELARLVEKALTNDVAIFFLDASQPVVELKPGRGAAAQQPSPAASRQPAARPFPHSPLKDWPFDALRQRGMVEGVIEEEELLKALASERQLTVYEGFDPTGSFLHIGHLISLRVLRWFQIHGHKVIFLIGDFTARIGDPTGRSATRPQLTHEQVLANAASYADQAAHVLDFGGENPAEMRFNGQWLDPLSLGEVIRLAATITVQRLIERDMFQRRIGEQRPLFLHEVLYPLLQGYDSVAMDVDAEVGGTDQMFNMLVGRDLVRTYLGKTKHVIMTPLIPGLDGRKMSKTYGNSVDLTEAAVPMFFKLTLVSDQLLPLYLGAMTDVPMEEIEEVHRRLQKEHNLQDIRERLASEIVTQFHGAEAAAAAQEEFHRVISDEALPQEVPVIILPSDLAREGRLLPVDIVVATGLVSSRSEARRLLQQGGFRLNGEKVEDPTIELDVGQVAGAIAKVGKRGYVRLTIGEKTEG